MKFLRIAVTSLAMMLAATPLFAQAGGENGPPRIVWAAQPVVETPYVAPNRLIWRIADILKAIRASKAGSSR